MSTSSLAAIPRRSEAERARDLFEGQLRAGYLRADRLFVALLLIQWVAAIVTSLLISPSAWEGTAERVHVHVWAALLLGGAITSLPVFLAWAGPGRTSTRHVIAAAQMLMGALLIHLSGGRIEAHFHVFGSLAFLALYRDWQVLMTATVVVALDHFFRGIYWPRSVFGVMTASNWRWLEHAGWVLCEDVVLIFGCFESVNELRLLADRQAEAESSRERVEQANATLQAEVAERLRIEGELRASEQRFRFLADAMPQIVWTTRPDGHVDYFNRRWYEFTGLTKGRMGGEDWESILHPDDLASCKDAWGASIRDGLPYQIEYRFLNRTDASYRWHLGRALPRYDEAGMIVQWVGTSTDIHDQKGAEQALLRAQGKLEGRVRERTAELERANEALQCEVFERRKAEGEALRARESAESASRAKGEFLANMSHEIRTPMNGILGMTELALDTELTPRQREYLGLVQSSAEALLTVINDILDFSKIEAGKLDLDPVPFELRGALDETMGALALRAHAKGLELACRIAPDVPDALVGDPGRLRQILVNLVGNAIKFTERGEVLVNVERERVAGGAVGLRVSVADTGIGIAPGKQRAIFEPFEQADGSMTRRYGGTGLGLAISTKLVGLMGGQIWVESSPGRGSTFRFTARLEEQPRGRDPRWRRDLSALADLPVLVVDDNATNRRILEEVLTNWGARPVSVDGGPEALKALRSAVKRGEPFPVALIDGMMPDMSGLDLAEQVRADRDLAGLVLLMLTSAGGPDDTGRYQSLGLSACLSKPIRQSELYNALIKALGVPEEAEDRAGDEGGTAATTGGLHILLAEDHVVNQKVAVRMLERMGHSVVIAADGRKAMKALEGGRFDAVLMDVQMPEMDGIEAVTAIRARERGTGVHIPVIALTAHAMKGDRERFLEAGFDGYLPKPVRAEALRLALEEFVARAAVEDTEKVGEAEWKQLLTICDGDPEFAGELAEVFLESAPRLVEGISGALEAGDGARLVAEAHGLKGISLTIGAAELVKASRTLEDAGRRTDLAGAHAAVPECLAAWEALRVALCDHARRQECRRSWP